MKMRTCLVGVVASAVLSAAAFSDIVIWSEDFSDVADWNVIFNAQADASTITSDGSLAMLYVEQVNNEVAYGPDSRFAFDPLAKGDYTMAYTVDSLTGSVSYDVRLDMFDGSSNYVGTVFNVVPQGTFTGSDTVNLGGFTYDPSTAYLAPKITVFTGPSVGDQTVYFDELSFSVVPEPSAAGLLLLGLAGLAVRARRRACAPRP